MQNSPTLNATQEGTRPAPVPPVLLPTPEEPVFGGEREERRIFTIRALLLGFAAAMLVCAYAFYNDYVIKQTYIVGNHFPLTVYSAFFLMVIIVNPLLRGFAGSKVLPLGLTLLAGLFFGLTALLFKSFWPMAVFAAIVAGGIASRLIWKISPLRAFSRGELVVILSLPLTACALPTSGLMRCSPDILVMPQYYGKNTLDWQKTDPIHYVNNINPNMFPQADKAGVVYDGFVRGASKETGLDFLKDAVDRHGFFNGLSNWLRAGAHGIWAHCQETPFSAWLGPVRVWFPILMVGFIFIICMCRIVHKQWSENEQLPYPIAEFANILMTNNARRIFADIFYNKMFWLAFGAVIIIHIINGWHTYDQRMIEIPMKWDLSTIMVSKLSFLENGQEAGWVFQGQIFLTVVAFAYFVPEEVSLSLGLAAPIFMLLTAASYGLGHSVSFDERCFTIFGAFVAMAGMIIYNGRYYYGAVIRRAFFFKIRDEIDKGSVWACRWFLASTVVFILLLMGIGLDWLQAVIVVLFVGMLFLVLARVSAESGVFFMQTPYYVKSIMVAALGPACLGPVALYVMTMIGVIFMQDTRECLSPYVVNSFRLASRNGVSPAPLSRAMIVTLLAGLFVSGAAFLWVVYDRGALIDGWGGDYAPNYLIAKKVSGELQKLKRTGKLEASIQATGLQRLSSDLRDPHPNFYTFAVLGAGLVLINSFLRLRYVWWPLHTVIFLFWGVWVTGIFMWSFLLGWLIKQCVVRFGGGTVYQKLKPLFIGLIIGDLMGGTLLIIYGTLRYHWIGESKSYTIFPG